MPQNLPATDLQHPSSICDGAHTRRARPSQASGSKIILVEFHAEESVQGSSSNSEKEASATSNKRQRGKKSRGACVHCKSLKVRCQFSIGESRCQRCIAGGHQCVSRLRKKRKEALTHEGLRERSRQQDLEIQSLLNTFDKLRMNAQTSRWIQEGYHCPRPGIDDSRARTVGPVTCHYYSSLIGPLDVDLSPTATNYSKIPLILRSGILNCEEVVDLFNLYFERINPFFSLLDGELHCPQRLVWKNALLFTVVCACAARHYNRRGLWSLANDIARSAAAEALVSGPQDVETVQALLILAVYPVPKKKWLEDKSWLFMGAAITMAQKIGLNIPPTSPNIRENLNRVRTWMNVFCVDASHATQFGKMPMVRLSDYIARKMARDWYTTLDNSPYDIGLCAYAELLLLMLEYRRGLGPSELLGQRVKEGFDVVAHSVQFDKDFAALAEFWQQRLDADMNVQLCPVVRYRCENLRMVVTYLRLVILSLGFQYRLKTGLSHDDYILNQSISVAQSNLEVVIDVLFPSGLLSWAVEANFLYMTFCASFLLNLLRPKLVPLLTESQCQNIVNLVRRLINILASDDVALDGRHAPAIYAKFLKKLLSKYCTSPLRDDTSSTHTSTQLPGNHELTPPDAFSWPDIPSVEIPSIQELNQPAINGMYELYGGVDMDFSIAHFVQSTTASTLANPMPAQTELSSSQSYPNAGMVDPLEGYSRWQQPFDYGAIFGAIDTMYLQNHNQ